MKNSSKQIIWNKNNNKINNPRFSVKTPSLYLPVARPAFLLLDEFWTRINIINPNLWYSLPCRLLLLPLQGVPYGIFVKMIFLWKWFFVKMIFRENDFSWKWFLWINDFSWKWVLVKMIFRENDFSWKWFLVKMISRENDFTKKLFYSKYKNVHIFSP